ncbi:MAG: right-handed parallel beta-helix repeat-containing protein, partial [Candidatus Micrarchaeia archaeon]
MGSRNILHLFFCVVLIFASVSFATNINNCQTLNTANGAYTLTGNTAQNSSTCFTISAANISVDCAGYTVMGTSATNAYGFYSSSLNTTIKNCKIVNWSTAINLTSAANGATIYNNNFTNLSSAAGATGALKTVGGSGENLFGIYALSGSNNITYNTFINLYAGSGGTGGEGSPAGAGGNGGMGGNSTAIYLSSSNNVVESNIISNMRGGTGGTGGYNSYIVAGTGGIGGNSLVIYFASSNNTLRNNSISNVSAGIGGTGGAHGFDAVNYGGTGGVGGNATIVNLSSSSSFVNNNTFTNLSGGTGGVGGYSVWVEYGGIGGKAGDILVIALPAWNTTLSGNNFYQISGGIGGASGSGGVGGASNNGGAGGNCTGVLLNSSSNSILQNSIYNLSGGKGGAAGSQAGNVGGAGGNSTAFNLQSSSTNTFSNNLISNVSFGLGGSGTTSGSNGTLAYGFFMLSSASNFFSNNQNDPNYTSTVQKFYSNSSQSSSSSTNTGWWPKLTSLGSDATSQTNTAYYNGSSGGKNADGTTNSTLGWWYNNIHIQYISACQVISESNAAMELTASVSVNGSTCFTISAQNVSLNCAGYTITGNNTTATYGVYSNQINTSVRNCKISEFDIGVYFDKANISMIENSLINSSKNTGVCVYFATANNNTAINITCFSLNATTSPGAGFLDTGENNSLYNSSLNVSGSGRHALDLRGNSAVIKNVSTYASSGFGTFILGNHTSLTDIISSSTTSRAVVVGNNAQRVLNTTFLNLNASSTNTNILLAQTLEIRRNASETNITNLSVNTLTTTAVNIIESNTSIDCQGGTITGSNISNTYGVYSNASNTTIKNCIISGFYHGISAASGMTASLMQNNSITTYSNGLSAPRGIQIASGANELTILNNSFSCFPNPSSNALAIRDDGGHNAVIANNSVDMGTCNASTVGIGIYGASKNITILNNTINNSDGFQCAAFGASPRNVTFAYNKLYCNASSAIIALNNGAGEINISSNLIESNGTMVGVYIHATGLNVSNNTFFNNTIHNVSTAFLLSSQTSNNTFWQNNITASVWFDNSNETNYFNSTSTGNIYYLANGTPSWNVFSIYNNGSSNWATSGSSRPFNATTVGGNWSGSGQDYHPYTSSLGCRVLSTANSITTLSSNVSTDGATCFNITAANVTLDCAGHSITGSNTTGTRGVYSNQFNTTIKNCQISSFQYPIYFENATNGTIQNDSITQYAGGRGMYIYASNHTRVFNNTIDASGNLTYGFNLQTGANFNLFENNTIRLESSANNLIGIWVGASCMNNTLRNNTVLGGNGTLASYPAVGVNNLCDYNVFEGNYIASSCACPVSISTNVAVYNTLFANNTIQASGTGLCIPMAGTSATLYNNTINANGTAINISAHNITVNCAGARMYGNNSSSTYGVYSRGSNTTIQNCMISAYGYGIYLSSANNSLLSNNTISNSVAPTAGYDQNGTDVYGIYSSANSCTIVNNTIINLTSGAGGDQSAIAGGNGGYAYGLYLSGSSNTLSNNSFANITASKGGEGGYSGGNGGFAGQAYGIYFASASNNIFSNNPISKIISGAGGGARTSPENGGNAYGIYLVSSANNSLSGSGMSILTAGAGGGAQGTGGGGGSAYGIYLNSSSSNNLSSINISGASGGNGGSGGTRGNGNSSYGIFLDNSFGTRMQSIISYNSTAGTGLSGGSTYGAYAINSHNANFSILSANATFGVFLNTSQNASIDCAGYTLSGNNSTGSYGVYSNQTNTTVKNCIINNYSIGVYFTGGTSGLIQNNTINNTLTGTGSSGIRADTNNAQVLLNNVSSDYYAIRTANDFVVIANNTATALTYGSLALSGGSANALVENNTFT